MNRKKLSLFRYLVQVIVLLCLTALTVYLLEPSRRHIQTQMEELHRYAVETLEARLGRSISYDSIAPSIISRFEIRNLEVHNNSPQSSEQAEAGRASGERNPLLSFDSVVVRYRLLPILLGLPENAVREIRVRDTAVNVDTTRDTDVVNWVSGLLDGNPATDTDLPVPDAEEAELPLEPLLPDDVIVSARNLDVTLSTDSGRIDLKDVYASMRQRGRETEFSFSADVAGEHEAIPQLGVLASTVSGEVSIGPGFSYSSGFLDVRELTSDVFVLARQQFRLQSNADSFEVRKVQDSAPVDMVFRGDATSMTLDLAVEGYSLSRMVSARGEWENVDPWLGLSLSGNASISLSEQGIAGYEAAISTEIPEDRFGVAVGLETRFVGNENEIRIPTLRATTDFGRAIFAGRVNPATWMPQGSLYIDAVHVGESVPTVTARFDVVPNEDSLLLHSDRIDYGSLSVRDVTASVSMRPDRYELDLNAKVGDDGTLRVRGSADSRDLSTFDMRAAANEIPVHEMYTFAYVLLPEEALPHPSEVPPAWRLTGSASVYAREGAVDVRTVSASVRTLDERGDRMLLTLRNRDRDYEGLLAVDHGALTLSSDFVVDRLSVEAFTANLDLSVNEQRYGFDVTLREGNHISIEEEEGSTIDLTFLEDGRIDAVVDLTRLEVPQVVLGSAAAEMTPIISLDGNATYRSPDQWRLFVNRAHAEQIVIADRALEITVAGRLNQSGGIIETLEFVDDYGSVSGAATVSYNLGSAFSGNVNLVAEGDRTGERYEAELSYDPARNGDTLDGHLRMRSAPIERFEIEALSGALDANITVEGTRRKPRISAGLTLVDALFDDEPISGGVSLEYSEERLSFSGLSVDYLASSLNDASGAVDFESGAMSVTGVVEGVRSEEPFTIDLDLSGRFAVEDGLLGADLAHTPFQAELILDGVPVEVDVPTRWEFDIIRDDSGVTELNGGPDSSVTASLGADGDFWLSLSEPLPFVVQAEGAISATEIEANLSRISIDVARIPDVFDFGEFRIVAGRATGSLRMTGPIFDPDFYGTLEAHGVEGELTLFPETIGPADGFIVFSEKQMRIQPLETQVGDAQASFEGVFLISRWDVEQFQLDIQTRSAIGPQIVFDFGAVDVDGYARGDIQITHSGTEVRLTGNLIAHNTEVTLSEIDQTDLRDPGPDDDNFIVDLSIEAGRSVEFLWPTRGFPVLRAVAQPGDRVRIGADTHAQTFSLVGDVGMQGGELVYLDRTFLVREGLIRFNETEDNFDPRLTVRAETRDIGSEGPIRISLIADESLLSELTVRVTSDPPLPQEELLALLGAGAFTSVDGGLINLSGAVLLGSDIASQFGVMRTVESRIRNALQLDLFTVRTQLFQNLVREVIDDPLPQQQQQEAAIPSLGRYFDNTTVFLGRSLGPDVFLELLVQLRSRDPFEDAERQFAAIDVDTELNLEFETPFFDIGWSFLPRRPEALFVPDNRFTLSWRFTY